MKIKVIPLFIILWGITNLLKAQLTPLFETTLYVEDAIGNRDTVMFGFDPMATSDIDEDFGEVALNTPFDSILEARFTSADNDILSKRMITKTANTIGGCWGGSGAYLYIHAVHQPITISWESSDVYDDCFRGAYIIDNILSELAGPIAPEDIPPLYYCMGAVSNGSFHLTEDSLIIDNYLSSVRIGLDVPIEGQANKTVYGVAVLVGPYFLYTPCFWVTENTKLENIKKVSLYPVPSNHLIYIDLPEDQLYNEVRIYNEWGILLQVFPYQDNSIDISSLALGSFIVEVTTENGSFYVAKGIKM